MKSVVAAVLGCAAAVAVAIVVAGTTVGGATADSPASLPAGHSHAAVSRTAPAAAHTARRTVRPVTAAGTPAPGYRVVSSPWRVSCGSGAAFAAVDPNIRLCGPTAYDAPACWKSTGHTVLCLRNPLTHTLYRFRYTGAFTPVAVPHHPRPQALRLAAGGSCQIRIGGAWTVPTGVHHNWLGFYSCSKGRDVYGPSSGDGINRSGPRWRVTLYTRAGLPGQRSTTSPVATAYYVGTAS